jgi:hypothetical protein
MRSLSFHRPTLVSTLTVGAACAAVACLLPSTSDGDTRAVNRTTFIVQLACTF